VFADLRGRVAELLAHRDARLAACGEILGTIGPATARAVAERVPWTRHARRYVELDVLNRMLAVTETLAHLELLVARGSLERLGGPVVRFGQF
jgi:hypothetical protein